MEQIRRAEEVVLMVGDQQLKGVEKMKYLGRVLESSDDECP